MPALNSDISLSLDKLADLLELDGANPFRIRAYRNAARLVGELPRAVGTMTAEDLAELTGIGKDLAPASCHRSGAARLARCRRCF